MKTNRWILPVAALLASATLVGGWFIQRERDCESEYRSIIGDAQVRRGPGGQCYRCRDEGWQYDIAYPVCVASDRPYRPR